MEQERSLIIIPIAHTYADVDMGSLREQIPDDEKYGELVTRYWLEIFYYLRGLPVDFSCLKVYQDGLDDTDSETVERIIEETQTANYEILRWLKEQGASIIGTENPHLLIEEHQSLQGLQAIFDSSDETSKELVRLEYLKKSTWLLEARDNYIAQRIRLTLGQGETGLLFIGVAHNVEGFLGGEIEVREPERLKALLPSVLREFWGVGKERK